MRMLVSVRQTQRSQPTTPIPAAVASSTAAGCGREPLIRLDDQVVR